MFKLSKNYNEYKILVVGAGVMGRSIAQVFAAKGLTVYLTDLKQEFLDSALVQIDNAIDILIKNEMADESYRDAVKANIHTMTNDGIPTVGQEIDCAFEVIFEDKDAKRAIYKLLSDSCRSDCIFASNTSGMDVFSVCDDVITNPERLIITHWFNPPHLMKLIEVVKGSKTSDEVTAAVRGLLEFADKKPAVLNYFVPGFIVNRIATVINRELYYMIDNGWISAQDAENAIKYTDGLRFGFEGPIALWDFVGLKIPAVVAKGVLPSLCNSIDGIPLAERLIAEGKTGVAVGEGLLKYPSAQEYIEKRSRRIIQMTKILEEYDKEDSNNG